MGSKWRKAKLALGCIQLPRTLDDSPSSSSLRRSVACDGDRRRLSDAAAVAAAECPPSVSLTPTPSSSGLVLSRHSSKSSKQKPCAICLNIMIPGQGHAIFTAECSHSFHFNCIASNVKHGNRICPVCRSKWKEIPFQSHNSDVLRAKSRSNSVGLTRDDSWMDARLPHPDVIQNFSSIFHAPEPAVFDDDDPIEPHDQDPERPALNRFDTSFAGRLEIKTFPEVSAVSKSTIFHDFTVLLHVKAPLSNPIEDRESSDHTDLSSAPRDSRASVDLVTVLDVSGSMAGTKLALLKRAMGFVIQNLGPHDRLSVIAFSSSAHRLFPLRKMTDIGRHQALQAVNSLTSGGGTNIAEGLKKGAKVMLERNWRNPVCSIILLSDGQDTYTTNTQFRADHRPILPSSIHQIPVHTFGFGTDHDAISMHSISESSGGTFSFIETESVIQDAFAQCIGGLLSVVVQELQVGVECVHPSLQLGSIKAGSYHAQLTFDFQSGRINLGDLYAEEERDFLVTMNIPADDSIDEMPLLRVQYSYKDPITKEVITMADAGIVKIQRPQTTSDLSVSMEVDRQRNRLKAAQAMSDAQAAAERGHLEEAVSFLERCRMALSETVSAQAGDPLCAALSVELKEMQERMANRQVYEASGRAYVLSGLSSHSWQRATARGDSTDSSSLVQSYQTTSMVDMVTRSQTLVFGSPPSRPPVRPSRSFSSGPQPR